MGAEKWTKEQLFAIDTRGCDLLVAAAAGSGKTAVLVERIIRMITDRKAPIDIDKLLVVTFTNAAAAEMKERIGMAISNKIAEHPNDSRLQKQLILLNRADITTIHSFCLGVVRENYTVLDIDPAFRIGDEIEIKLMKSEIMDDLFEMLYDSENNVNFLQLVEGYGEGTGDSRLRDLILKVYNFIQSSPFPERWLNEKTETFHINQGETLEDTLWTGIIRTESREQLLGAKDLYTMALHIAEAPDGPSGYIPAFCEDISAIDDIINALEGSLESVYDKIQMFKAAELSRKKDGSIKEMKENAKYCRDGGAEMISKLRDDLFFKPPKEMTEDIKKLYPIVSELTRIVKLFSEAFSAEKKERQIVDFNDLEHFCLKVLVEEPCDDFENPIPTKVAYELQDKYTEILTDEYQDSNSVQEMILSVVSKKSRGENNRFMVGDVKQSIYRFRQARPEIFTGKYLSFSTVGEGSRQRIDLFQNFRSRAEILECINFLFGQFMTKELGGIEYDDKAALHPGANFPDSDMVKTVFPVEVDIINCEKNDDDAEEQSNTEAEADFIGDRINSLINEEKYNVFDKNTKCYRPVMFRDIVILMRSPKSMGEVFVERLAQHGVPAYAESTSGFYDTVEVMTVLSFLQIIDNPLQDIPLAAVLRSPVYEFTADELLTIRLDGDNTEYFKCIRKYCEIGENENLKKRLTCFLNDLWRWRELVLCISIDELIWNIYNDTGFYDYVGVMDKGSLRQSNLQGLVNRAVEYEKSSMKGLFHFISYIERIKEADGDSGMSAIQGNGEDIVRIISIHKSKGLEFPVVFVAGLGKEINKRDIRENVLLHHELGFGTAYADVEKRVIYETISRTALAERITRESISEEIRVLYVAFTRAKERLILTGTVRFPKSSFKKWSLYTNRKEKELPSYSILRAATYLDWIMPALARHRDGGAISDKCGMLQFPQDNGLYYDASKWCIRFVDKPSCIFENSENDTPQYIISECDFSKEPSKEESEKLVWNYNFQASTAIPSNISISEIKRINNTKRNSETLNADLVYPKQFKSPNFYKEEKGLTAAEIGTAMHTVLENLDFSETYNDEKISEIIDSCVAKGILSATVGQAVPIAAISAFTKNELFRRIHNSKNVFKEQSFAMSLSPYGVYGNEEYKEISENILVHGIIDCFFVENDEIVLIDYKSDRVINEKELTEKYAIQMKLYKQALERAYNKPVKETFIYSLFLKKTVKIYI